MFVLYSAFLTKLLVSVVWIALTYISYTAFLTTLFFTTVIGLYKSTGVIYNLQKPNL